MLKVTEIFKSIQGESTWAGLPTTFIRLTGCNLRCNYCDTKYSYNGGEPITIEKIIKIVHDNGAKQVCVTGGEPLLQSNVYNLMTQLCDLDFKVSLETGGHMLVSKVDPRVKKIIDVKTPDSGEGQSFKMENLQFKDVNTEFKFIICSKEDLDWSDNFVRKNALLENNTVLYSPSYKEVDERWLAENILEKKLNVRLHLQLHKYIWSFTDRGI